MKYFRLILITIAGLVSVQCSDDSDNPTPQPRPDWNVEHITTANRPDWKADAASSESAPGWRVDLSGTDEEPAWEAPNMNLYPTSMTSVLRLTPLLEEYASDGDKVAAFIGGECRGIAEAKNHNGVKLFYLQIKAAADEQRNVTLFYYSSSQKRLYESDAIRYEVDKIYGTASQPVRPTFERSGRYPCVGSAYVALSANALPFTPSAGDEIAAFVGNDCRSIVKATDGGVYHLLVMAADKSERLRFKYYSAQMHEIYVSKNEISVDDYDAVIGSADNPVTLSFEPQGSMVAYLRVGAPLANYQTDGDILGAFVGDRCVGIAERTEAAADVFAIRMKGVADGESVDLKYYSAHGAIVESRSALTFAAETVVGTTTLPLGVEFDCSEVRPLKMKAYIVVDEQLMPRASTDDLLAAFCGDECRAVASGTVLNDGRIGFRLEIAGKFGNEDQIVLKYYSAKTSRLYRSVATFAFDSATDIGSAFDYKTFKFELDK